MSDPSREDEAEAPTPLEMLTSVDNPPEPPPGLSDRGRSFWEAVVGRYELRVDELELLREACRVLGTIDRLAAELSTQQMVVRGSQGQDVANPLLQEIARNRQLLLSHMRALKLPDGDDDGADARPLSPTSLRAQRAAQARWSRERATNAARGF
jgi:hypothetical protein